MAIEKLNNIFWVPPAAKEHGEKNKQKKSEKKRRDKKDKEGGDKPKGKIDIRI